VRVEESGHYIQRDRPDVVINSAREIAGCSRAVAPAVGPGPPDGRSASNAQGKVWT
jgi:hypothetical protein